MADPLATLGRLRRLATDQARRDLAATLAAERLAADRLESAQAALAAEASVASTDAADPLAGAYARWLPAGQARRTEAAESVRAAEADVATARTALSEARAAARAVEVMAEDRAATKRRARLHTEQTSADDLSAARKK